MCSQELSSLHHPEENPTLPGILIKKRLARPLGLMVPSRHMAATPSHVLTWDALAGFLSVCV